MGRVIISHFGLRLWATLAVQLMFWLIKECLLEDSKRCVPQMFSERLMLTISLLLQGRAWIAVDKVNLTVLWTWKPDFQDLLQAKLSEECLVERAEQKDLLGQGQALVEAFKDHPWCWLISTIWNITLSTFSSRLSSAKLTQKLQERAAAAQAREGSQRWQGQWNCVIRMRTLQILRIWSMLRLREISTNKLQVSGLEQSLSTVRFTSTWKTWRKSKGLIVFR